MESTSAGFDSSIEVGRIGKAHGVRGELKVDLHWSGSTSVLDAEQVWLDFGDKGVRVFQVEHARPAHRSVLLKLVGIDDRTVAETLRGARVRVPRETLPELEEGEYYLVDLIGSRVVGPEGPIGEVVEIRPHPSVDCIVIRTPDGKLLEQPMVEAFVARVDLEQKLIELSTSDGLVQ